MKKGAIALVLFVILVAISPRVASAKWWNPFSWFQKSSSSNSSDSTVNKIVVVPDSEIDTNPENDAHLQQGISNMRAQAEMYSEKAQGTYQGLCSIGTTLTQLGKDGVSCTATNTAWAASVRLSTGVYLCADSSGATTRSSAALAQGSTTCPTAPLMGTDSSIKNAGKTVTAKVGDTIQVRGITAKIMGVEEDSRCAEGVQCVWAGTVKVKVHASYGVLSKNIVLALNDPYTVQNHEVTLTDVTPSKKKGSLIFPSEYTFTFSLR